MPFSKSTHIRIAIATKMFEQAYIKGTGMHLLPRPAFSGRAFTKVKPTSSQPGWNVWFIALNAFYNCTTQISPNSPLIYHNSHLQLTENTDWYRNYILLNLKCLLVWTCSKTYIHTKRLVNTQNYNWTSTYSGSPLLLAYGDRSTIPLPSLILHWQSLYPPPCNSQVTCPRVLNGSKEIRRRMVTILIVTSDII